MEGQLSNRSEKIKLEDDIEFDVSELTYAVEGARAERVRGPLLLNHEGRNRGAGSRNGASNSYLAKQQFPGNSNGNLY